MRTLIALSLLVLAACGGSTSGSTAETLEAPCVHDHGPQTPSGHEAFYAKVTPVNFDASKGFAVSVVLCDPKVICTMNDGSDVECPGGKITEPNSECMIAPGTVEISGSTLRIQCARAWDFEVSQPPADRRDISTVPGRVVFRLER